MTTWDGDNQKLCAWNPPGQPPAPLHLADFNPYPFAGINCNHQLSMSSVSASKE